MTLKQENRIPLAGVVMVNYLICTGMWAGSNMGELIKYVVNDWKTVAAGGIAWVVAIVLTDAMPSHWKQCMTFLGGVKRWPGGRAFNLNNRNDPRVDWVNLERRINPWPTTASEQNQVWYRLLKENEGGEEVRGSHGRYLLWRDWYGITVVAMGIATVYMATTSEFARMMPIISVIGAELVITRWVAAHNGQRLASTVLAAEGRRKDGIQNP